MMKTEDTMAAEKKAYSTPELVEHGTLSETTHGYGNEDPHDAFPTDPFIHSGGVT